MGVHRAKKRKGVEDEGVKKREREREGEKKKKEKKGKRAKRDGEEYCVSDYAHSAFRVQEFQNIFQLNFSTRFPLQPANQFEIYLSPPLLLSRSN